MEELETREKLNIWRDDRTTFILQENVENYISAKFLFEKFDFW
jgi:hypothetical protein